MKARYAVSFAALAAGLAHAAETLAQYPTRAVRLVVPFAAGSGTDNVARFIQPQLSADLGQQVVIENRAGAGGNLGAEIASKAAPDGYTIMLGNISNAVSMNLYARPGYDLVKDFEPIMLIASGSFTVAAHPSVPAKTIKELIALAKRQPGALNVAVSGAALQLSAKMFESMAGIKTTEVNYKSTPQTITAVVSGEAAFGFPATSAAIPHAKAGRLRALAVTSARRAPIAPEVPTVAEAGVPGYEVSPWYGFMAPARTPKEALDRFHAAAASAIQHPDVRKRFAGTELELIGSTPERLEAFMREDIARWARIIRQSGMKAQ